MWVVNCRQVKLLGMHSYLTYYCLMRSLHHIHGVVSPSNALNPVLDLHCDHIDKKLLEDVGKIIKTHEAQVCLFFDLNGTEPPLQYLNRNAVLTQLFLAKMTTVKNGL